MSDKAHHHPHRQKTASGVLTREDCLALWGDGPLVFENAHGPLVGSYDTVNGQVRLHCGCGCSVVLLRFAVASASAPNATAGRWPSDTGET